MGGIFTLKRPVFKHFVANQRPNNSFLYCTNIYNQSETSVYRNLPLLNLRNHLIIKASILPYGFYTISLGMPKKVHPLVPGPLRPYPPPPPSSLLAWPLVEEVFCFGFPYLRHIAFQRSGVDGEVYAGFLTKSINVL